MPICSVQFSAACPESGWSFFVASFAPKKLRFELGGGPPFDAAFYPYLGNPMVLPVGEETHAVTAGENVIQVAFQLSHGQILVAVRYPTPWKRLTLKRSVRESVTRNIESSVGTALDHLAECFEDQQSYAEAEPLRRRSLEITERGWGKIIPYRLAEALETYAALLRKLGRAGEAEDVESRARPIRAKYPKGSYSCQIRAFARPRRISLRWRLVLS